MFDQFKARAEAVSAEVHRFATKAESLRFVVDFLNAEDVADEPASYALWHRGAFFNELDVQAPGLRFEVTREFAAAAKVGISEVDWAVAQTGTLLVDATPIEQRLVSSLPLIHIALAATDRMVPDMRSGFAKFDLKQCAFLSAITGPSRTADIERVLTIGVHGPKRLVVVFVDELGKAERQ
jgi:L-lactate dehydrogenase complex protein LldG